MWCELDGELENGEDVSCCRLFVSASNELLDQVSFFLYLITKYSQILDMRFMSISEFKWSKEA